MVAEKRFRFLVSDDFLALIGKQVKEDEQQAEWLCRAIVKWDGVLRGIPLSWLGKRHLNLDLNSSEQKVMARSDYPSRESFLSAIKQHLDEIRRAHALSRAAAAPKVSKVEARPAVKGSGKAEATPAEETASKLNAQPAGLAAGKGSKGAKTSRGAKLNMYPLPDGAAAPVSPSTTLAATSPAPTARLSLVATAQNRASAEPEELTQDQVDALHARLLEEQRDIIARMSSARNDNTDRVVDVADIASKSQDEEERQMFRVRLASQLQQVVDALKRIREGDYGWCEETGEPIGWHRLSANPSARYSVYAQARRERSERVRVA